MPEAPDAGGTGSIPSEAARSHMTEPRPGVRAGSVPQSCPTPGDPMDCSWPGSSAMGFSRQEQEHWNGLPFPTPGDLPDPGIEPMSLVSATIAGRFFTAKPPGKPPKMTIV